MVTLLALDELCGLLPTFCWLLWYRCEAGCEECLCLRSRLLGLLAQHAAHTTITAATRKIKYDCTHPLDEVGLGTGAAPERSVPSDTAVLSVRLVSVLFSLFRSFPIPDPPFLSGLCAIPTFLDLLVSNLSRRYWKGLRNPTIYP